MVSIFTPTFNRAYIIGKLYESLCQQTNYDFEWIVVDDGSTDDTQSFFYEITQKSNPFHITYVRQPNGGKHRAINRGVKLARGELFFIVDSDDRLTENAVEMIQDWVKNLPHEGKWAGVAGLRGYDCFHMIGSSFQGDFVDATSLERAKKGIAGDKAEVFFTEVIKQFPFQEFEGENFLTEDTVWLKIAQAGYSLRWFNTIIYLCDYLEDGLTKNLQKIVYKNPQGALYTTKIYLDCFQHNIKKKYGSIYRYYQIGTYHKLSKKKIAENLNISVVKLNFSILLNRLYHLIKR